MRPINKGSAPKTYVKYEDARDDLIERIGMYCSYCEMIIKNMPAVEHVIPRNNGGPELEWENFLLSCIYCNSNKSDDNHGRVGFLWPDEDNTFKAFKYEKGKPITVNSKLSEEDKERAQNTINLLELNREPHTVGWNNHKDTRYISRISAWGKAYESLKDWDEFPCEVIANCIARTAISEGHFSIWMEVFKNHKPIMERFVNEFKGTEKRYFMNLENNNE